MSIKSIKLIKSMDTASGTAVSDDPVSDTPVSGTSVPARVRRIAPLVALPACMTVGVLLAFAVVVAWFPKSYEAWNYPLHQIDAPAHYYFIRRILDEGIGAATHLWPNDAYYPPLFHLLAAGLIVIARLFGVEMNIYTAFNVVWIAGAGLVWPAGMQLFASYWTCRGLRDARAPTPAVPVFPCAMALIVPLLSVASASHPFQMLASGPLVAYGLAFSLLPFWLYCTMRWFDAIVIGLAAGHDWREAAGRAILRWGVLTALTGGITVFAHPRMTFTWLLFIGPFLLLRLPWRFILAALAVCVVGAIVLFAYMVTHYKSDRYLNPGDWFHTFVPNRTVPDALRVFVTDNIAGPAGVAMAVTVVAAIVVTVAVLSVSHRGIATHINYPSDPLRGPAPLTRGAEKMDKDAVSVLLVVFLFALLYVCSTALTGWFPNIVAAVWYRAETRPLTMIPLAIVTLLVFAASALRETVAVARSRAVSAIMVVILAALAVGAQFGGVERAVDGRLVGWGNSTRAVLAENIHSNMVLNDSQPDEQLTDTKYDILADVARTIEPGAAVISDPLNGSMYGKTVFDVNMLYPIYNPMAEKNGAIFGAVERAFDSGDKTTVLNTVCPIEQDKPEYFLVMGGQAPSLEMFTFRQQYDPFHRDDLIARYTADGTLVKVRDYSDRADYAKGWALYRFGCAR